ncbi:MAG TPA: M56 family metallopeptidase [Chitinophagaceae bacterium]|nr:M56 family metallopeptidase [Chitinophagaceae bacterium]
MTGQHFILQIFGWALLHSLWQMALLWVVYRFITAVFTGLKSSQKTSLASIFIMGGFIWFVVTLLLLWNNIIPDSGFYTATPYIKPYLQNAVPVVAIIYFILLIIPVSRFIKNYRYVGVIRNYGLSKPSLDWRLFVNRIAAQMGIKKTVQVWVSEWITSPVTVGFFKPVILLPLAAINHLSPQQVEAVLLHELAHIRRHDYFINLIIRIIRTLLYFNPFIKALTKEIEKEREIHCDEMVLQFQYNAYEYANALLTLEKQAAAYQYMVIAAAGDHNHLLHRVKLILGQKTKNHFSLKHYSGIIIGLFCVLTIGNLSQRNQSDKSIPENKIVSNFSVTPFDTEPVVAAAEIPLPQKTDIASIANSQRKKIEYINTLTENAELNKVINPAIIPVNYFQPVDAPELKNYQEAIVKDVMSKSKTVIEKTEWKEIEKQIAEVLSMKEKEELKAEMKQVFNDYDWSKIGDQLRLSFNSVDWNQVNDQLNESINQFKTDSLQRVINDAVSTLKINRKQIEENALKAAESKVKAKALDLKIAELNRKLLQIKSLKNKKIIHL